MTKEELFDYLTQEKGGRLDTSAMQFPQRFNDTKRLAEGLIACVRRSVHYNFPEIHFDIIKNPELNALAGKNNTEYFIGQYAGGILLLFDFYNRIMCFKKILPKVGEISLEIDPAPLHNAQLWSFEQLLNLTDPNDPPPFAKSDVRRCLGRFLHTCAVKFTIYHEMAHIINGHVDMINNKGAATWNELNMDHELSTIDFQTLEMDADSWATHMAMVEMMSLERNGKIDMGKLSMNRETYFKHWAFAVTSAYAMQAYGEKSSETMIIRTHPPTWIRLEFILGASRRFFEVHDKSFLSHVDFVLLNIGNNVRLTFEIASVLGMDLAPIDFTLTPEADKHFDLLMENYNKLKNILKKYTYGPLATRDE